jgi:hypothetical protein
MTLVFALIIRRRKGRGREENAKRPRAKSWMKGRGR